MISLNEAVSEYTRQLKTGTIQRAYRGVMDFMAEMKSYLEIKYPHCISGNLYIGYMDMTYFPLTPAAFKEKGLKTAIVYLHAENRMEIWLAAANRKIQSEYHHLLKSKNIGKYALSAIAPGVDAIIESVVAENPDFDDPDTFKELLGAHFEAFMQDMADLLILKG